MTFAGRKKLARKAGKQLTGGDDGRSINAVQRGSEAPKNRLARVALGVTSGNVALRDFRPLLVRFPNFRP
jgi:hypothetical protein